MKLQELFENNIINENIDSLKFECEVDVKDNLCNYIKQMGGEVLGAEQDADQYQVLARNLSQETIDKINNHPKIVLVQGEGMLEASPYSSMSKLKDKAVGATKGLVGGGQVEQGRQEAGKQANLLFKQFKQFLGQSGGDPKMFDPEILVTFLSRQKGVDVSKLNIPQVNNINLKQTQSALLGAGQQIASMGTNVSARKVQPTNQQTQAQPAPQQPSRQPVQQTKTVSSSGQSNELWNKISSIANDDVKREMLLKLIR